VFLTFVIQIELGGGGAFKIIFLSLYIDGDDLADAFPTEVFQAIFDMSSQHLRINYCHCHCICWLEGMIILNNFIRLN